MAEYLGVPHAHRILFDKDSDMRAVDQDRLEAAGLDLVLAGR